MFQVITPIGSFNFSGYPSSFNALTPTSKINSGITSFGSFSFPNFSAIKTSTTSSKSTDTSNFKTYTNNPVPDNSLNLGYQVVEKNSDVLKNVFSTIEQLDKEIRELEKLKTRYPYKSTSFTVGLDLDLFV